MDELPRWNLDPIFSGPESPDYQNRRAAYRREQGEFLAAMADLRESLSGAAGAGNVAELQRQFLNLLGRLDSLEDLREELGSYLYCLFSTDTRNPRIIKEINGLEEDNAALHSAKAEFKNLLAEFCASAKPDLAAPGLENYRYFILRGLEEQKHQMGVAEEALAAQLSRSGADAWSRLQEALSSQLSAPWEGGQKTLVELRGLASHPSREVRALAFEKELELWRSMEVPLAYSLNGVKGTSLLLSQKRGYSSPLEAALVQARISAPTLRALTEVMKDSLPVFRRYFLAKARGLGLERLAFYDLLAPRGRGETWTFEAGRDFILGEFSNFSPALGNFARRAFEGAWIDPQPREGKAGGAYCTPFPLSGESRIFCNFDGSFDGVTTIAHELGHAYHSEIVKALPAAARQYPMTLAETASIFAEQIIFGKAYRLARREERSGEALSLLETSLIGASQVIVDILSRFYFESRVFDRRKEGELSPKEFCDLMLEAQEECYLDALAPDKRHPYMWAVKGHYYISSLDFYNFPYAFGLLFGLGLYSRYEEAGADFIPEYDKILLGTGLKSAEEVCAQAGFDITRRDFWQSGIDVLARRIDDYENFK